MDWVSELQWAIELTVMHARWCRLRGFNPDIPETRRLWLKLSIRLGDHAARRIVALRAAGKKMEIRE